MTTQQHRRPSVKLYMLMAASFLLAATLMVPSAADAQSMVEYTTTTPLVSNQTVPNVLLVFDNSGSMDSIAVINPPQAFSPTASFAGFFDPTKCYQYDGSKFVTTATADIAGSLCTSDL